MLGHLVHSFKLQKSSFTFIKRMVLSEDEKDDTRGCRK